MIREKIRGLNDTARELTAGVLLSGLVMQAVGMWLTEDKLYFTAGLWTGVLLSAFMALHMNRSIQNAVSLSEEDAPGYYRKMYALRAGVVLLIFGCAVLLQFGNVISLFLGLFSLKIGAYLQPVLHKLLVKMRKKGR